MTAMTAAPHCTRAGFSTPPAPPLRVPISCIAEEVAVAISYGGIPHAVMMATPLDLDDLVVGFSLTEEIVRYADDIRSIDWKKNSDGFELDVTLAPSAFRTFLGDRRVRTLRTNVSCGLCGIEDLAGLRARSKRERLTPQSGCGVSLHAVDRAVAELGSRQPLHAATHAAHAAAWASPTGDIYKVREDIGRHNALDKLIGALHADSMDQLCGFCLVTSRCSFEMVQKAVNGRLSALVAISSPTSLAIQLATTENLILICHAGKPNRAVYAGSDRICI